MPSRSPTSALARLEELKLVYEPGSTDAKRELLEIVAAGELRWASQVHRLHEILLFLRTYPDDRELLDRVETMLAGFDARADLSRCRSELENSGIAGTRISYAFYWFTAEWIARRWPDRFHVDWELFEGGDLLRSRLEVLMSYSETLALEEAWFDAPEWVELLRGESETDAAFLVRRFAAIRATPFWKERLFEELELSLVLEPGPTTPSRSRARGPEASITFQTEPLKISREVFPDALARPPKSVRRASRREARRLTALAREAMISRSRDLDGFIHADPADVRIMDGGGGLVFVCYGVVPERRQMLDSVYAVLILKNGVPMGYFLASALFRSALVAYNIFDTYRGGEAAYVYGRALAMVRHVFRVDTLGIEVYQLGHGNKEALESGAWWFYYKLGFRPHDPEVKRVVRGELAAIRRNRGHRSSIATLERLAAAEMYLHLGRERDDVVGRISREAIGLKVSGYLAERFGSDRERGERVCAAEVAELLGVRSRSRFSPGERLAWRRWSPLVKILPRVERWSESSRRALAEVIRAKGGPRESDFVERFDRHRSLRRAILELAVDD